MTNAPAPIRAPRSLLVTGGCGFIGSAFVRRLFSSWGFAGRCVNLDLLTYAGNPHNVQPFVDPDRYVFERGDIADGALLERLCTTHAIDAIVNFAAETHVDRSIHSPGDFVRTNIVGTFELLEVVRRHPHIHLHHVSTDEVFGALGPKGRFHEDSPYKPSSPYSAAKASADHLVRAFHHTYGLSTTISNCGNNYGPFQFPEKLIPLMILCAVASEHLPVYGDGKQVRDWIHVDDHADAIWDILRCAGPGTTWNVGSGCELENLDIVERICRAVAVGTGRDVGALTSLVRFVADRPGHDRRYAIDPTRVQTELGWAPRVSFEQGIVDTVNWYLENTEWVERVKSAAYRTWFDEQYGISPAES